MTSKVRVNSFLCNFTTMIEVTSIDEITFQVKIESPCEKIREFAKGLEDLTIVDFSDWPSSLVQKRMLEMKLGASCLVPSGLMNAGRLEAGLISKSLAEEVKTISIDFIFD